MSQPHEYNEANARRFFKLLDQRFGALSVLVRGPAAGPSDYKGTLARMLEDGGFPETESRALKDALDVFEDALNDLEMAMMLRFDPEMNPELDSRQKM